MTSPSVTKSWWANPAEAALLNSPFLLTRRLHTALWWNNNKYSASQLHRGGGGSGYKYSCAVCFDCIATARPSWLPANNWLYWELTLPPPAVVALLSETGRRCRAFLSVQIESARPYLTDRIDSGVCSYVSCRFCHHEWKQAVCVRIWNKTYFYCKKTNKACPPCRRAAARTQWDTTVKSN